MTMNRAQRRELKRRMKARGHVTVTLHGGPMDGWHVQPDAPALQPDWREHWLEAEAEGEYLKWADAQKPKVTTTWDRLDDDARRPFREAVRAQRGPGRYVLRSPGIDADWQAEP